MKCTKCGKKIADDSVFCRYCGAKTVKKQAKTPAKEEKQVKFFIDNLFRPGEELKAEEEKAFPVFGEKPEPHEHKNIVEKTLKFIGPFNFMAAAIVFAFLGQNLMFNKKNIHSGLIFFAIGAVLFFLAHLASSRTFKKESLNLKAEIAAFLIILIIAAFFRFSGIVETPAGCFADEAQNGREAVNMMQGKKIEGHILPVFISRDTSTNPAYFIYIIAAVFKFFGIGPVQVRVVSGIMGFLSVAAFYMLARYLFGVRAAIIGGLLLAVMRWHVNFSRIGFHAVFGVFLLILVLYFTYRMYKSRNWSDFILFGFVLGLSQYGYIASRTIPITVIVFFAYLLLMDFRFYFENRKKILIAAVLCLITFAPLGFYMMKHWDMFMLRQRQVSIMNKGTTHKWFQGKLSVPDALKQNFNKTVYMYNVRGDGNPRHNLPSYPVVGFYTGALAFLGFGYLLFRILTPFGFFTMASFWIFLLPGILTIEAPQALRTIFALPVILLFALVALERTIAFAREQYGEIFKRIVLVLIGIFLVLAVRHNYDIYFNKYAHNSSMWTGFSTYERLTAEYILDKGPSWYHMVQSSFMCPTFEFMMLKQKERNFKVFEPGEDIPVRNIDNRNYSYILSAEYEPIVPLLKKIYPGGKYIPIFNKFAKQHLYFFIFEVPNADIVAQQGKKVKNGLMGYYYKGHNWSGPVVLKRVDPFILFNWTRDPVPGGFSVRWEGSIQAPVTGLYKFQMKSNDYSDLYIGGKKVVVNERVNNGMRGRVGSINLKKGRHKIRVRYYESINGTKVQMWWKIPGRQDLEVVPHEALLPERE